MHAVSLKMILNYVLFEIIINVIAIIGYCSQCYRKKNMEKERLKKEQDFSKFEEKKRQQTDKKKSFKNVFKKSSNAKGIVLITYTWK